MIEVIVVLVILGIMGALTTVGVGQYIEHARQVSRDSVARTIFMASQTALTHEYNQDRNYYTNNHNADVPAPYDFLPDGEAVKQDKKPKALVYLKLDGGTDNSGQPLYKMLAPYMNDKAVLDDSILIEYNRETGRMLSAFYSDTDGVTFGYGSGGSFSVRSNRGSSEADRAARADAFVGFYGVDSTGEVIRENPIDTTDFRLLLVDHTQYGQENYGLLTAEIDMPAQTDSHLQYTLTLSPLMGTAETITFSDKAFLDQEVDFTLEALKQNGVITADMAIENQSHNNRNIPVYCEQRGDLQRLVFILDGVQSFDTSEAKRISIRKNFPNITGGFLTAELELTDGADSVTLYSDDYDDQPVHAFYGGNSSATELTVLSVRHLNNIRLCRDKSKFVQKQGVYMVDYKNEALNFAPIGNRLDTWKTGDDSTDYGFYGTYRAEAGCAIYDLHIDLTGQNLPSDTSERMKADDKSLYNAGLFDTIRSGATVENVRFLTTTPVYNAKVGSMQRLTAFAAKDEKTLLDAVASVQGVYYAGGIAAVNEGTIRNCAMPGYVSADMEDEDSGVAGGIAGINRGNITRCATVCTVSANKIAGGIAGENARSVTLCEAGSASWRSAEDSTQLFLSGAPYYGIFDDEAGTYPLQYTKNSVYRIKIHGAGGAAGGIAGKLTGSSATVLGCVNACKVEAGYLGGDEAAGYSGEVSDGMAGGVVGQLAADAMNYAAVGYSYNAGDVYATGSAGGVVGDVLQGAIKCCYNTGNVNLEFRTQTYAYYFDTNLAADKYNPTALYLPLVTRNLNGSPPNRSGGILGSGTDKTSVSNCYNMQYAGDAYGGAFGILDEDALIENCYFLQNIRNTQEEYYVTGGRRESSPGLHRYSAESLRAAPSDGNKLDSAYFANGSFYAPEGVGTFHYKFPYLKALGVDGGSVSQSGDRAHRTPWRPTIGYYGDIEFDNANTFRWKDGEYIYISFRLAPPEGWIYLRQGSASSPAFTLIPLFDERGRNSLTDLRLEAERDPNAWHYVYGYDSERTARTSDDREDSQYTFYMRARKLDPANTYDAQYIAEGFSHEYTLRIKFGDDNGNSHFPNTYRPLYAELYYQKMDEPGASLMFADDAVLREQGTVSLIRNRLFLFTGYVLEMDIHRIAGNGVRATFLYSDNTTQTIEIRGNALESGARSYIDAYNSTTSYTRLKGDSSSGPFPYYIEDDKVCVILHTSLRYLLYNSGLKTSYPIGVTVEELDGNSDTALPGQHLAVFRSWYLQ